MKITRIVSLVILCSVILFSFQIEKIQAFNGPSEKLNQASNNVTSALNAQTGSCHFGITVLQDWNFYDLSNLGVGNYLDWNHTRNNSVASNIQYEMVVRVVDAGYTANLAELSSLLDTKKGMTWIVGNEPDSGAPNQDYVSAETYAVRFYEMAKLIRSKDPTAKIAFGTIIQPTPVRLKYLTNAVNQLILSAAAEGKTRAEALSYIDIYSIHAFNLPEVPLYDSNGNRIPGTWGSGVPRGYDANTWPAYYNYSQNSDVFDINIFKSRVTAFRQWMKNLGEQAKPLWITEYGVLFTTKLLVSDAITATFMEQSYDYMLGTKDANLGYAADSNRLVQKWFWYSLNDDVALFGGSLYNPKTNQMTEVGTRFMNYNPSTSIVPVTNPDVFIIPGSLTIAPSTPHNYKVTVMVGNNVSSDRKTSAKVELLLGGNVIGTVSSVSLPRCSGMVPISFNVTNLPAGQNTTFTARVSLLSGNGTDIDTTNNSLAFPVTMPSFYTIMLPAVRK